MLSIIILALFSFVFLGTEFLFDNIVAQISTPDAVVVAQSLILGASVIGFVTYPFIRKWFDVSKRIFAFVSAIIVICCIGVMYTHPTYWLTIVFGLLCYVIYGMWGSHAYDVCARYFNRSSHIARNIGISYAIGIAIQFINNNIIEVVLVQFIIIICAMMLMLFLLRSLKVTLTEDNQEINGGEDKVNLTIIDSRKAGLMLIAIVALMACIFSTLDNKMTLVHANGNYDIGQLPRVLLAASGLAAGFLFDICKRKYMYISMYCITLLSVMSIVVMQVGGVFIMGLIVFYLAAGFYVVFFSTSFIDLSYESNKPMFWAGMGRAVNGACSIVTGLLSVYLLQHTNDVFIMISSLVLLAILSICIFIFITKIVSYEEAVPTISVAHQEDNVHKDKFEAFCKEFAFTDRECEVMQALMQNDIRMQEIAANLYISRTALYRHVAKLNEKTNTSNRISLIQFYHQWGE